MTSILDRDEQPEGLPFGAWLLRQPTRGGLLGELIAGAIADRRWPKAGDPEAVRKHLSTMQVDGDMFDAVDDAEADWRSL